ncbi:hypothetical protein [Paenibacillus sp. IHBB 3054]|uniref:hypothetical protein n=1 Tax=Paenibacillus sp. IHBB 3054 TaxID=3425689 RepID=UPI003F67C1F2
MDKKLIERDLREEMTYWLQVQQDAHLRGGEVDLKIAEYASKEQRRLRDKLLDLWDGEVRKQHERTALIFANEKQSTGSYPGRLNTDFTNYITDSLARNEGERNAFICRHIS